MKFEIHGHELRIDSPKVIVAGWTARDADAVEHHIEELAAIGVPRPSQIPLFYRVSSALLTQDANIEVLGSSTSGEIEPLVLCVDNDLWLGVASDHTDRDLETVSVAASKQACAKPVGRELWKMSELEDHLDQLQLRAEIWEDDAWVTYQKGELSSIRPLLDLVNSTSLSSPSAMLCGTLGAIGGVRPASRYRMTLHDPMRQRTLGLDYGVTVLPVVA